MVISQTISGTGSQTCNPPRKRIVCDPKTVEYDQVVARQRIATGTAGPAIGITDNGKLHKGRLPNTNVSLIVCQVHRRVSRIVGRTRPWSAKRGYFKYIPVDAPLGIINRVSLTIRIVMVLIALEIYVPLGSIAYGHQNEAQHENKKD